MIERLPFVKATACGNDFLLIDGDLVRPSDMREITEKICDRHLGIGADGVEWLFPSDKADIQARLINSDGSDAEVSGNGTRCVAAWYVEKKRSDEYSRMSVSVEQMAVAAIEDQKPAEVRVLTDAGVKTCTLISRHDMDFTFRSDMGEPVIAGELTLDTSTGKKRGIQLSMGNPQFIVLVDEFAQNWAVEGAEIERHKAFPQRTNMEFVKVTGPQEIEIRIFERGAGETQSSGTGSCASAIAAIHKGRVKSPVKVVSPGGPQTVQWDGVRVLLTGPARIVCRGEFFL
jgi:diaminopimelate epimerase